VKAEIRAAAERKDALGEIRQVSLLEDFVLEDPLVPDVDTSVTARRPGQMRIQMERKRPHECERHRHVARQRKSVRSPV
jgi:hypothetical protein